MNDLESDDPPTAPEPEPQPDPAPAPVPDPDPEPEGAVDVGGSRMVPVGALIEERRAKQALKAKADQFDALAGYVHQARPYLDFLQAHPDIMTRMQQAPPTPERVEQPDDEQAVELARTLDLYTAEGKPDVVRAQKVIGVIDRTSDAKAKAAVAPLQQHTAKTGADFMYQRALATKAPDGRSVDRDVLDAIWLKTDPRVLATEEGAAGVLAMALGLSVMRGAPRPAAPAPAALPPLYTDAAGGRTVTRAPLSALEQGVAKLRGLNDKTYAERTKGFIPGRPSSLEDD